MQLSEFGFFYIAIALVCFFQKNERYLLSLLLVSAVLQAASVVNLKIGVQSHGLTPFIFTVGLLVLRMMTRAGKFSREVSFRSTDGVTQLLLGYLLWAMVATSVMPLVFEGVLVRSPYDAYTGNTTPLRFSIVNAWQVVGLLSIAVMFAFPVVCGISKSDCQLGIKQGVIASFILVVLVNLYEQLAHAMGFPSFAGFWASNPGYNQEGAVNSYGWHARVGVPFTEPSYASVFIASFIGGGGMALKFGHSSWTVYVALLFAVLALLSTGGGTGMVSIAMLVAGIWLYCLVCVIKDIYHGTVNIFSIYWLFTFVGLACVVLAVFAPGVFGLKVREFFSGFLLEKLSIAHHGTIIRLNADLHGFQLLKETYGLGVGLGSNRTSSFLSSLFCSLGLIGVLLYFGFVFQLIRQYVVSFSTLSNLQLFAVGALPMMLLSLCLSIPDLNLPVLWTCLLVLFLLRPPARV